MQFPRDPLRVWFAATTSQASAFSPCNITGFFRIHDSFHDPLRVGSTGAAVALANGVTTRVSLRSTRHPSIVTRFNGQRLDAKAVSNEVARVYSELDERSWQVEISHKCRFPPGRGYGTSGAGALGLSLALNEVMGLSFSKPEAAQIAHLCEIQCKTGLGTVASVFWGGLTVRTVPGAPEIGQVRKLALPSSLRIVSGSFGPISTRRVLANHSLKKTINGCGRALIERFLQDVSYSNFMSISRKFSDCVGLISSRLGRAMNTLDSSGFSCSMMMLGESLFCLLPREDVSPVEEIFRSNELTPATSKVARSGARLI
ncbi:MAG TPA: pantoate kinase [Dongiaceae bacterium]|nr:pantoate kinase [Dongiaceae bacterium]